MLVHRAAWRCADTTLERLEATVVIKRVPIFFYFILYADVSVTLSSVFSKAAMILGFRIKEYF